MTDKRRSLALILSATLFTAFPLLAGNLDSAPFVLKSPGRGWIMDSSIPVKAGDDSPVLGVLMNMDMSLKAMVRKVHLEPFHGTFNQLQAESNRMMALDPANKIIAAREDTFAGNKAQFLALEVTKDGITTYQESFSMLVGDAVWVIVFFAPREQRELVKRMYAAFSPKKS